MNTPSTEMLKEAARHMKRQNNYEKWELLSPLSKEHHFMVDFRGLYFMPTTLDSEEPSCSDENVKPRMLPLDAIFGILILDNFLYILCENGVLFMLGMENKVWSLQLPVERSSPMMQLSWGWQCWAEKVRHWWMGDEKE